MADEIDLRIMPAPVQRMFVLSLGAAYKSLRMLGDPVGSLAGAAIEMKTLMTPPASENGFTGMLEAMAGAWVQKGMTVISECEAQGQKFVGGESS